MPATYLLPEEPEEFAVEAVVRDDFACVSLRGELDVAGCPVLRESLAQIALGVSDVLVDVDGLTYLDSSGISVLVMACKRIRSEGGTFALVHPWGDVQKVLEITGLIEYFHVDSQSVAPSARTKPAELCERVGSLSPDWQRHDNTDDVTPAFR